MENILSIDFLSYRVGYQSAYDLRVYDNAPIGVRHPNVICDACRKHGIIGMRWKCARCFDFDLCTHCYMALDKHDLTHPFLRFETATNTQVILHLFFFSFENRKCFDNDLGCSSSSPKSKFGCSFNCQRDFQRRCRRSWC